MIPTEFNGSQILYSRFVRPYFLKHHSKVDESMRNLKMQGKTLSYCNLPILLQLLNFLSLFS